MAFGIHNMVKNMFIKCCVRFFWNYFQTVLKLCPNKSCVFCFDYLIYQGIVSPVIY